MQDLVAATALHLAVSAAFGNKRACCWRRGRSTMLQEKGALRRRCFDRAEPAGRAEGLHPAGGRCPAGLSPADPHPDGAGGAGTKSCTCASKGHPMAELESDPAQQLLRQAGEQGSWPRGTFPP